MSEGIENISGAANQGSDPDFGVPALPAGSRTYENYLNRALTIYLRAQDAFSALKPDDRALLKAADRWKRAAVSLERWAASLFNKLGGSEEERNLALEIMARVTNDSAFRSESISRYYDLLAENKPEAEAELEEAEKADLMHLDVLNRMINTQSDYIRRLVKNDAGENKELQLQTEYSRDIRDTYSRIPAGHKFRPAYVYPPERVPEDEPLPEIPEPIDRYQDIPFSEKVYDTELDEFVLPEGYISEDGMIDSQSMVFYPETMEVEFGFVGGPRQRWKYWKPKDDRDVPKRGDWVVDYYQRWYREKFGAPSYRMPLS